MARLGKRVGGSAYCPIGGGEVRLLFDIGFNAGGLDGVDDALQTPTASADTFLLRP